MALLKWSDAPFEAIERSFINTLDDLDTRLSRRFNSGNGAFTPSIDISEDSDNFYVISELPGMKEGDVKATVDNGVLTISGSKERNEETKERNYHRIERSFGQFVRSLSLPTNIKASDVVGTFRNGLLELTLPKIVSKTPEAREIPLNSKGTAPKIAQNGHKVAA